MLAQHQASPKCFHSRAACRDVSHLCLWPRCDFWVKLYQSALSISSDSLVLDGEVESLLIIQQLLKIQVTSFVSR